MDPRIIYAIAAQVGCDPRTVRRAWTQGAEHIRGDRLRIELGAAIDHARQSAATHFAARQAA